MPTPASPMLHRQNPRTIGSCASGRRFLLLPKLSANLRVLLHQTSKEPILVLEGVTIFRRSFLANSYCPFFPFYQRLRGFLPGTSLPPFCLSAALPPPRLPFRRCFVRQLPPSPIELADNPRHTLAELLVCSANQPVPATKLSCNPTSQYLDLRSVVFNRCRLRHSVSVSPSAGCGAFCARSRDTCGRLRILHRASKNCCQQHPS